MDPILLVGAATVDIEEPTAEKFKLGSPLHRGSGVQPENNSLVMASTAFQRAKQNILENISRGIDFSPKGDSESLAASLN
jgi:hypothetical protein